jgi:hypothetical protein
VTAGVASSVELLSVMPPATTQSRKTTAKASA